MSDPLFDALDQLVPSTSGEHGDWSAVVRAAGLPHSDPKVVPNVRHRRRLTRRQLVLVGAVVAAITVVSATPAFGLHDLLLDLVGGRTSVSFDKSRPAPAAIKKQFLDIAIGAPRGMNPGVLPDQARQIGFRGAGGRKRVLWVAPTRTGGFCFDLVGAGGGCITKASERQAGPVTLGASFWQRRGEQPKIVEVDGHVFSPRVASLTLEFQDHDTQPLPFVYVSTPINAGFYISGVPPDHQEKGHWPIAVVARDSHGVIVATKSLQVPTPQIGPNKDFQLTPQQPPQTLPTASTVDPTSPTQTATADGITVVAGANGDVRLTAHDVPATIARLLRGRISISCFRLTREFGIFTARELGISGAFADSIGLTLNGVGHPLDGCEIGNGRGHRWPDPLGSHTPVELAFTTRGHAYFTDRAAARDLAFFVRSGRMQKIRKEPDDQLLHDMKAAYGTELAHSRIRYSLTATGITFTETSPIGKTFRVVVENGKIKHSNVEPYAKVF